MPWLPVSISSLSETGGLRLRTSKSAALIQKHTMSILTQEPPIKLAAVRTASTVTQKQRFECLTALRFFPLFCVVFHHSQDTFACLKTVGESYNLSQASAFFFVFSGFILAHNYMQLEGTKDTCRFYLSRLSRIWPSHVLCLFLLIALLPEVFKVTNAQLPMFFSNLFLVQAWVPSWNVYFSYNAPSWTCSTLVALYLGFPFLAKAVKKCWYLVVAGAAALVLLSIVLCNVLQLPECQARGWSELGVVHIHPLSRLFEFVIGMVAAFFFRSIAKRIRPGVFYATALEVSAIALVWWLNLNTITVRSFSIPLLTNAGSLWLANSGIPVIPCAILIMILALQRGLVSSLLNHRVFVVLGEISFSMFLLHGVFLAHHQVRYPQMNTSQDAAFFLLGLLLASCLMTVLFEKPVRKFSLKFADNFLSLKKAESGAL